MHRLFFFPLILMFVLLAAAPLQAANIQVRADHDPVGLNETFTLTYELDQQPDAPPDFSPLQSDFEVINQRRSSSFSIINGRRSASIKFNLVLRPRREGKLVIPAIQFGSDTSPQLEITAVEAANFRPQRNTASSHIAIEVEASPKSVYVQQQITYTVRLLIKANISRSSTLGAPRLQQGNAMIEQLGQEARYSAQRKGENWQVVERRYAVTPQQSGTVDFEPIHFEGQLVQQRQQPGQFDPFNMLSTMLGPVTHIFSDTLSVEVKPIPPGFSGKLWLPAGKLNIHSKWETPPDQLKTGEPATLTISVVADGLRAEQLPEPEVAFPSDLKSYSDQAERRDEVHKSGVRGILTQKLAVVPTKAGTYKIPPIEIPWWNITSDKMEIARLDAITVKSTGATVRADASQADSGAADSERDSSAAPSATASADSAQTSQWWKTAALLFALMWLLTIAALFWYLKLRNRKPKPTEGNSHNPLLESLEAVTQFGRLRCRKVVQAARSNDPQATRDALLKWGEALFPEAHIHSLSSLLKQLDGPLAAEVNRLNLSLYSSDSDEWSGTELARSIQKWHKSRNHADSGQEQEQLPPLNKL